MNIKHKKDFVNWINIKSKLDESHHKPPLVENGNIWWCRTGKNIGTEISGKGSEFARPVIIHTKVSKHSLIVIPATTKILRSDDSERDPKLYVKFKHSWVEMLACLNQIQTIDYRRLKNKIGYLDDSDFDKISQKLIELLQKNKLLKKEEASENPNN
jgi:mRNA-degrading endonuclease toxin of MazEF toxin-antitoxin module